MEVMSRPSPAYLAVEEKAFAFSDTGDVSFSVFPRGSALAAGNIFIVDIYADDDHSHPNGHAGWWEHPLTGASTLEVKIVRTEAGMTVFFDGQPAKTFWCNDDFRAVGRKLVMHLVVRAWRSTTILFNDPVCLYPDQAALDEEMAVHPRYDVPDEVPMRWFVWPPNRRVLLTFGSLRSAGARTLCHQLTALLRQNNIPCDVYAHVYDNNQRTTLQPVEYLCHQARRDDIVFFVFAEGGPVLPLVADLPCKKVLYHMHLPDYRRYQAFDAEFARTLADVDEQQDLLTAFDGICYESEHTQHVVTAALRTRMAGKLAKAWPTAPPLSPPATTTAERRPSSFSTETLFCALPDDSPAFLPQRLALTVVTPNIPPTLGVFPPALWRTRWDTVDEEECRVPENFIFSVGSFRPDKHYEEVLRIFAAAAERHPSIGLVIAGWPSINGYWDYIRFLREHTYAQFASRIIFLQGCSEGQLLYLYKRARLFLTACSYEGYSGSLMDALTFDLPIVARRTFSIRQLLGMSGLQFDGGMPPENVADDVLRICDDEYFRTAVIQSQREYAERGKRNCSTRSVLSAIYEAAFIKNFLKENNNGAIASRSSAPHTRGI